MKNWMIAHHNNFKALEKVISAVSKYLPYVPVCNEEKLEDYNAIELIVDKSIKGVEITVTKADGDSQSVVIKGEDNANLLYAVSDFKNLYLPYARNAETHGAEIYYLNELFSKPLKPYNYKATPSVKDRGLWLWGYTIYDYRRFIDNMVELKFNTLIIWNDYLPVNLKEVVDYARENYIKIYLGFAWGWDTVVPSKIDDAYIQGVYESVLKTYETNYANLDCDGIYFQSFTEHSSEFIGGVPVAEAVTNLVNTVGNKLLQKYSNLKILFGLHYGSVKNRLDAIKKVDDRISIIWEDVGAFPYHYVATKTEGFTKTVEDTLKIRDLRENGGFGVVLKGVICLDWKTFTHYKGNYVLGKAGKNFIKEKAEKQREILRIVQAGWLKNGKYALELIKNFNYDTMVTCLVEDGVFEEIVNLPTALYSAMLWNYNSDFETILFETAMREDVDFV